MRGGKRLGAGRPVGSTTNPTRVARVPLDITNEDIAALPSLKLLLDHWEEECEAAGDKSARHYFLRQAIADIRALGL